MRIAVTGASGLLGRFVVAELASRHTVVALDRRQHPEHDTIVVDVLDGEGVAAALAGCEAVIHLAAIDQARTATEDEFYRVNVLGAWNVLSAAERRGLRRAVVCSSVAALGLRPEAPPDALPIGAEHPLRPVSAYGMSKQATETIAAGFARRGALSVACLRPALITFPELAPEFAQASATSDGVAAPAGLPRITVPVAEPLPLTRAYVSPEDCARAFAAALHADVVTAAPLYVTARDTLSVRPTVDLLAETFGAALAVTRPEHFAALPQATPFDLDATMTALAWEPRDRWADVVARAAAAHHGEVS